jgi:hypothetical protein
MIIRIRAFARIGGIADRLRQRTETYAVQPLPSQPATGTSPASASTFPPGPFNP